MCDSAKLEIEYAKQLNKQIIYYADKDCPCENTIIRILREKLEYKITKVKKNKVQKKIKETDEIFNNVNLKKKNYINQMKIQLEYILMIKLLSMLVNYLAMVLLG